jgi:hypothetical protein
MVEMEGKFRLDKIEIRLSDFIFISTFTFWRFTIRIPLGPQEMRIAYCINKGQEIEFFVPGSTENMRCAAHSVRASAEAGSTNSR